MASTLEAAVGADNTLLRGLAVANGSETTCWFEWGVVGDDYPNKTAEQSIGSGASVIYVTNSIPAPQQACHFRLVASNSLGVVFGPEKRFGIGWAVAWGDNYFGKADVPANLTNVVAVVGAGDHSLALRANGTVVAWGANLHDQATVPTGLTNVVAIAGGYHHSLALRANGTVVAWGNKSYGQATVPTGLTNVVAIAGGAFHSMALRADGTVDAWGDSFGGQTTVPADLTNVVAIAGGVTHSLALRADGTVIVWGHTTVPANLTNVVAIAGGMSQSLALRADGSVLAWGDKRYVQTNFPADMPRVLALETRFLHCLALSDNGTVVAWGDNRYGQAVVPANLTNVVAISAGDLHNLALAPVLPPPPEANLMKVIRRPGETLTILLENVATNWVGQGVNLRAIYQITTNKATVKLINAVSDPHSTYSLSNGAAIVYTNDSFVADQIHYVIKDSFGRSTPGYIDIYPNQFGGTSVRGSTPGEAPTICFYGVPSYSYDVMMSTNLLTTNWVRIWTTNAPAGGWFEYQDTAAPERGAFYRLRWNY